MSSIGLAQAQSAPAERLVVIATAPVAGVSYAAGGALCNLINRERARHGLRCLVESTAGSAENLDRLRGGDVHFAIVQSDWQYLAVRNGTGSKPEPFAALRAVFSLYPQVVTVVAHPQAGIQRLEDLKGRRVSLGPEGSGLRAAAEGLVGALGWRPEDFEDLLGFGVDEQVQALCDGRIDAFVLPVAHPNGAVALAAGSCGAVLVQVAGAPVERLVEEWPFYAPARVPAGVYKGNAEAVASYGTRATLVSTTAVPENVVYELAKAALGDTAALSAQHPALADLDAAGMVAAGNTAPHHAGALRYYRERGWK